MTFSATSDGSHSLLLGTLRQTSTSLDMKLENADGETEVISLLWQFDPFFPDNDTTGSEELTIGGTLDWACTYDDDGSVFITIDCTQPHTILPFTPEIGGFTGSWAGVTDPGAPFDPQIQVNGNLLAVDEYDYDYFDGMHGTGNTWMETYNLNIVEDTSEPPPEEIEEINDDNKLSVWGFNLDGHKFYVFRLGDSMTLVYDRLTGQWMEWRTEGETVFRPHLGLNWLGVGAGPLSNFSWNIVGGDDRTGILWNLDPEQPQDTDELGEDVVFTRQIIGAVPMRQREGQQCGGIYVIADLGDPVLTAPNLTLYTSDDDGRSWVNHGSIIVQENDDTQELAWIGLGLITSPGRLFKFEDTGAVQRISSVDMRT